MIDEFQDICDKMLAEHSGLSHAARLSVIEDLRLRFKYPAEHVAFIDEWDERGKTRQLIRRVIAHSKSPEKIEKQLGSLETEAQKLVKVRYIDPLDADIELPEGVGLR